MSLVDDQVRQLDALLDKFQLATASRRTSLQDANELERVKSTLDRTAKGSQLKSIIRALSTTAGSRPLLRRYRLGTLLQQLARVREEDLTAQGVSISDASDLEWLAAGKATIQLYGVILSSLLEQTIPLSESIWYWDDILGSYVSTCLYTAQTFPLRFWKMTKEVYRDAKVKLNSNNSIRQSSKAAALSIRESWKEFYALVQNTIEERSVAQAQTRILSPFALSRTEARRKQNGVKRLREMNATAIGLLVNESFDFSPSDNYDKLEKFNSGETLSQEEWRSVVVKSVSLLENVLRHVSAIESGVTEFEDNVFSGIQNDPEIMTLSEGIDDGDSPKKLIHRLRGIYERYLPDQEQGATTMTSQYGMPSRLIRLWIPSLILVLSGGTILRMIVNRRAEMRQWIQDLGATMIDFWSNWVVDPVRRIIATIRRDESSEIAIQSRDSLKADRESLERMVVDFAVQHPENGVAYNDTQLTELRAKVKEGDLTPVLRVYEHEMQSPIKNAIMGDLVRTLLIQVQKTKVDVELAIGGIDSLLKSQELLFGFIGVAPGILISWALFQWLRGTFGGRSVMRQSQTQGETIRLLRNIDRTLNTSTPTSNGMLSYKDHGLLLCEVYVLRERAASILPGSIQREFLEDINDLLNIRIGIERQIRILQRIQWAYAKWLR